MPSLVIAATLIPVLGFAQGADADPADDPVRLEKFEVTGSYIPFSADAPAVPVRIVGSQEIAATGITNDLLEVIR
ncbi:MAG TPA: hypothetical protein VEA63_10205, partial [Opitutus sp.]|nr:hypothetical protein [Opitutus sp.]